MEDSKCQPVSLCLFHPLPLCLWVCVSVCVHVCLSLSVCMNVCLSLCVLVCVYVFIYMHVYVCLVWTLVCQSQACLPIPFAIQNRKGLLGNVVNCCWGRQSSFVQLVSNGFCFESTSSFKSNLKQNSQIVMSCGFEPKTGCISARIYSWLQETPPLTIFFFYAL